MKHEYKHLAKNEEVKYWIEHNLVNYLKKHEENLTEIEHIIDYLNSDKAPKRLKSMSYAEAKSNTKKWNDSLIKKAGNIVETDQDVKVLKRYPNGFQFVRLKNKPAFEREGNLMRHCVASYHDKENVKIYSLRDSKNQPHCTIEVTQGDDLRINQIKGKGNGEIHPEYIKFVLDFLRIAKMEIRDTEMENLGYFNPENISTGFSEFLSEHLNDVRYITFNNTKYIYLADLR